MSGGCLSRSRVQKGTGMSRRARTYVDLNLNPIRKFRKGLSLTITEAAQKAGVNVQTWYLTERGACRGIPAGVAEFMQTKEGWNNGHIVEVETEFRRFQHEARQSFWEIQGDRILKEFEDAPEFEPINFLERVIKASGETPISLAKNLCVAPTVLMATLNGRRQKLPREILAAFVDAGWPVEKIVNTGIRI